VKKINRYMKFLFCLLSSLLCLYGFSTCCGNEYKSLPITYSFFPDPKKSCRVFISYKDSTGYLTLYTEDEWSKEVYLPHNEIASLLIVNQNDADEQSLFNSPIVEEDIILKGQIEKGDKTVTGYGKDIISIALLK